ncbi:splicing factor 3B subunit 2-like [Pyrus ussuriensis x Pyrus communis]|uniref:Splicing factor 3B subunit 2-like n=1 Tax=Pyrus ussuriensis x Pyrus communis TaxID=2448454 RepID=A0A5N5HHG1_9ROSA|nr:splicing factor 3B subunit 2-like [Pyrus ussuriensis x Pyrus communis]
MTSTPGSTATPSLTTTPTTAATTPAEMDHRPVNPVDPVGPPVSQVQPSSTSSMALPIDVFADVYVRHGDELTESLHATMVEKSQSVFQESASQLPLDTLIESVVELLRGQKADKVEVTIQPEELDDMETVLPAKYEEAREEEKL